MHKNRLTPIFLTAFGRSGTTLLMQLLGSNEKVIFDKEYPYENRIITYFYRLANLPFSNKKPDFIWNNDNLFSKNLNQMGKLPLNTALLRDNERLKADLFKRLWNGISHEIKEIQYKEINPLYYAEKIPHDIPPVLNKYMYTKNLFLLRDPRDELLSIMNFNKKRGTLSFGWKEEDTPYTFAQRMINARKGFMNHFINLKEDERRYKVKYEDLVQNFEQEAQRLSKWLGVELNPEFVKQSEASHTQHMTSSNPEESVAKWKTQLENNVLELFKMELGKELEVLGYEV